MSESRDFCYWIDDDSEVEFINNIYGCEVVEIELRQSLSEEECKRIEKSPILEEQCCVGFVDKIKSNKMICVYWKKEDFEKVKIVKR